jgi:hypothetical protein
MESGEKVSDLFGRKTAGWKRQKSEVCNYYGMVYMPWPKIMQ